MIVVASEAYTNAQMPYLLQSGDYFDIPFEQIGTSSGSVLFYPLLLSTMLAPLFGYCYDIFGRKLILIPAFFILAAQLSILPYAAPHFWLLCIFRGVIVCCSRVIYVNPLITDYVKSESRGLGTTISTFGFVFGDLTFVGIYEATRSMTVAQ